eukprot:11168004-Alexandrium_andersonii.AAC.1
MDRAFLMNLRAYFPEMVAIAQHDEKIINERAAAAPELDKLLNCSKCGIYSGLGSQRCQRCNGLMPVTEPKNEQKLAKNPLYSVIQRFLRVQADTRMREA